MIATLTATPVSLALPGPGPRPNQKVQVRWLGSAPRRPAPKPRVQLAAGVWIVPNRTRRFGSPDWMAKGLCTQLPTAVSDALFFGVERRAAPGALIVAANTARELCADCPVRTVCLTHALIAGERYGVWGGTSGRQRAKMRNRMHAGAGIEELVSECLPLDAGDE